MLQKLHELFIKPRSRHPDHAEREIVLNVILVGMVGLSFAALINLIVGWAFFHYDFLLHRFVSAAAALVFFGGLYLLARYRYQQKLVSWLLIGLAFAAAAMMVYQWGLLVPTAILLFSLVIIMAGILQSARSSLYVACAIIILFTGLQIAVSRNLVRPDLAWMDSGSTVGDVVGFSALFLVIALVSWLFNRQMMLSLNRAQAAEAALQRQNERLEEKVLERTRELEKEQLEKMQQMYRFAELGHVSTALFHDLANHVSTVSIDIENLHRRHQSAILERIDENIHYIDAIVRRVRSQLQGKQRQPERLDVEHEIREVVRVVNFSARAHKVRITKRFPPVKRPLILRGDILRFRQLIMNLLSNAVEAYKAAPSAKRRLVEISLEQEGESAIITVRDQATGIPTSQQERVFDPFYSSKQHGVGIGLFIVKQVTERDFSGHVSFISNKKGTVFTVRLPLSRRAAS